MEILESILTVFSEKRPLSTSTLDSALLPTRNKTGPCSLFVNSQKLYHAYRSGYEGCLVPIFPHMQFYWYRQFGRTKQIKFSRPLYNTSNYFLYPALISFILFQNM
jgi:hypothetical protein